METSFFLLLGTVSAAIVFGFVIGKISGSAGADALAQSEFQRGKAEAELEKAGLAIALGDELLKLRDGIQNIANCYESTVRVVHKNLSASVGPQLVKLGSPMAQPTLSLELEKSGKLTETTFYEGVEASPYQEDAKIGN